MPAAAPPATAPVKPTGDPTDRMIGAILPAEDRAWFFKVVGPIAELDSQAEAIQKFIRSIDIDGDLPKWQTPDGWTELPQKGMRLATLQIPAGSKPLELSVIGLPLVDQWDAQVLSNVNRWRKQLMLEALTSDELAEATQPLSEIAEGAVLIDATGWYDGGSMPPFAAGGARPSRPPVAAAPPAMRSSGLQYDAPAEWTEAPGSAMRKASLKTPGGAEVTAFAFPAAGAMGDPLANVNRWRGEVGLAPTDAETLAKESETLPLLGSEGQYFELVGEKETTHAAMVERDGQVWFFKIRGPIEVVPAEREAFLGWLKSLSL